MTDIEYVTACFSCAQGLFSECLDPLETPEGHIIPCIQRYKPAGGEAGGGALAPTMVTDAKSTGRKRAVMLAPILEGMLCEWAGLLESCGGGGKDSRARMGARKRWGKKKSHKGWGKSHPLCYVSNPDELSNQACGNEQRFNAVPINTRFAATIFAQRCA